MDVFGRYDLLRPLGQGKTSEAFVACRRDLPIRRQNVVVLKRMLRRLHNHQELCAVFAHESAYLAQLRHPHVLRVIDSAKVDGELFQVTALVDGMSLGRLLDVAPMSTLLACHLVAEVGSMLEHLRHTQWEHDLTSANILIGRDGIVRLADLGLTRGAVRRLLQPQAPVCQASCATYALGVLLYRVLGGRSPLADDLPRAGLPTELAWILRRALDPIAARRFESPARLREALLHFIPLEPVSAQRALSALVAEHVPRFIDGGLAPGRTGPFQTLSEALPTRAVPRRSEAARPAQLTPQR